MPTDERQSDDLASAETLAGPTAAPANAETLAGAGGDLGSAPTIAGDSQPGATPNAESALVPVDASAYIVGGEIARGGMGRIASARDRRLRREVALKTLLPGKPQLAGRFEREVFITARLQHPSIVRVYEAGRWPDGQPFYAMEKVRGKPLDAIVKAARTLDERLALLPHAIAVAEALAYAHNEGIVHRDLKPANVLVGEFGETVVIDWGLAKDLRADEAVEQATSPATSPATSIDWTGRRGDGSSGDRLTMHGSIIGTPAFMSPEQARADHVDERTDVYALGALLYTVLAGETPFRGHSTDDVIDKVAAGKRPASLAKLQPGVPAELLTIVERAMAPQPVDRYASAREVAEELRRFQTGQLVASHQYGRATLLVRWIRRHRAAVVVTAVSLLVVAALAVLSIRRIVAERDRAAHERRTAQRARDEAAAAHRHAETRADELILRQARASLARDPSRALAWLKQLSPAGATMPAALALARTAYHAGVAFELRGHTDDVELVRMHPAGRLVVSASDDGTVRVWNLRSLGARVFRGHVGPVEDLAISRSGRWVVSGGADRTVRLWAIDGSERRVFVGHRGAVAGVAISPDETRIVSTSADRTVQLWTRDGGGTLLATHQGQLRAVAFSSDGATVYAGSAVGSVDIIDVATRKSRRFQPHREEVRTLAAAPGGALLASGAEDGQVKLWRPDGGDLRTLGSHTDMVRVVAFTPDGRYLVSAGGDAAVRVFEVATGNQHVLAGNSSGVKSVTISADGKWVASAGIDNTIHIWPVAGGKPRVLRGHTASVKTVAFTPDASAIVSGSDDDTIRIWQLRRDNEPAPGTLRTWLDQQTNASVK